MSKVLNPALYEALEKVFGKVKIAKQGYKLVTAPSMYNGFPSAKVISSGEAYRVCCPICGDHNFHLYVSYAYGSVDEATGSVIRLAHCFRHAGSVSSTIKEALRWCSVKLPSSVEVAAKTEAITETPVVSPGDCIGLDSDSPKVSAARQYVADRGIDPSWAASTYGLSFCVSGNPEVYRGSMEGRIIIPMHMKGVLKGWQARRITPPAEGETKFQQLRYISMPGSWRSNILFGYDQAVAAKTPYVIMVEGPFDLLRQGPPCVATLGQTISGPQFDLVATTWGGKDNTIFVIGDSGEDVTINHNVAQLQSLCQATVLSPRLPHGDPGEWDRSEFFGWLSSYVSTIPGISND